MALFADEVQQNHGEALKQSKPSQPDTSHSKMCTDLITWSNPSSPACEDGGEKSRGFSTWADFSEGEPHVASGSTPGDDDWATFNTDANSCSCNVAAGCEEPAAVQLDTLAGKNDLGFSDSSSSEHRTLDSVNNRPQDLQGLINGDCVSKDACTLEGDEECAVTPEWQEFTFGGDTKPLRSETVFTEPSLPQYESDAFRTSKPRSASLPVVSAAANEALMNSASSQVLSDCFHTKVTSITEVPPLCTLHSVIDERFWSMLSVHACSPDPPTTTAGTVTVIGERLVDSMYTDKSCHISQEEVDLGSSDQEDYDWTLGKDPEPDTLSLDLQPSLFRSKPVTPVDIEFDHSKVALGLSTLSMTELESMCDEMSSKVTKLSEELVTDLQQRDLLVHQMELKNKFISTMLKVQNLRHAAATSGTAGTSSGNGSGGEGVGGAGGRGRSWSVRNSMRNAMKPREEKSSGKFLLSIIPYTPPDQLHWSVSTLQQLTKILQAIAEDSDTVPALVADYLQSEVLKSPIREKTPPPLEYSRSCDDSFSSRSSSSEYTS